MSASTDVRAPTDTSLLSMDIGTGESCATDWPFLQLAIDLKGAEALANASTLLCTRLFLAESKKKRSQIS